MYATQAALARRAGFQQPKAGAEPCPGGRRGNGDVLLPCGPGSFERHGSATATAVAVAHRLRGAQTMKDKSRIYVSAFAVPDTEPLIPPLAGAQTIYDWRERLRADVLLRVLQLGECRLSATLSSHFESLRSINRLALDR